MKQKNLKNYQEVPTEDGSITLYSSLYGENCHSTSGAASETRLHYIQGCKVDQFSRENDAINILEVGFGTGLGFSESLKVCESNNCFLNFVSFEIDSELIEYVLAGLNLDYQKTTHTYEVKTHTFNLIIFFGNARNSIKQLSSYFPNNFDVIYQDAFSPKRNAILWTTQWFMELKTMAQPHCILSTYSASSSIRKSLIAAQWFVTKGEKFGPKRSSTRANLIGPSDQDILEQLNRSPAIELTDNNYQHYQLEGNK